jgi:hypothetical protein
MPALPKIIVNEVDAVDVVLRTIPKKIDPTTQPATQPTTQPSSDPASPDPAPKEEITTSASVIPMSMMLIIGGAAIGLIGLVVVSMVVVMRKGAGS